MLRRTYAYWKLLHICNKYYNNKAHIYFDLHMQK